MRTLRRFAGLCLAAGLCFTTALPAAGVRSSAAAAVPTAEEFPPGPITFLGVGGLRWSDVDVPAAGPQLAQLSFNAATAAMAVRTALPGACPIDGWLTLNSGSRAVGPRPANKCLPIPAPTPVAGGHRITQWAELVAPNTDYSYDPVWGTLAAHGRPDTRCAIGPGAALALADDGGTLSRAQYRGELPRYDPAQGQLRTLNLAGCDLAVVDAGALPEGPDRVAALEDLDRVIGDLIQQAEKHPLVVAGISDSDPDSPHLSAVLIRPRESPTYNPLGRLHSPSTRQSGLVQITDLTPTLLAPPLPPDLPGAPLQFDPGAYARDLPTEFDITAQAVRSGFVFLFVALIAGQILSWAGIAYAWRRGMRRTRAAALTRLVGLWAGSVPAATYLVNLLDWPQWSNAATWMWVCVGLGSVALAGLADFTGGRLGAYGPPALIAALTLVLLSADVAASSRLQLASPFGLSPLVAGRFYGFGNIAFAVFAMSTLLLAAAAWVGLRALGRERLGLIALVAIGGVAVVIDGAPGLGTDFGGVLALAPGLAVLALALAGIRLSPVRLAAIAAGAVGVVAVLAVADWTRPDAERTHLGRFVQDVLDGNALGVLGRKADANLTLFTNPVIVLATVPLLVAAVLAVTRPRLMRLNGLVRAQEADPAFRALLVAALTTALLGFAANDSGIIVPAVALFTGAPLFVAVWAQGWAGPAAAMAAGSPPNAGPPRIEAPVDGPGQ